jgi:FkbM family methyltransferase
MKYRGADACSRAATALDPAWRLLKATMYRCIFRSGLLRYLRFKEKIIRAAVGLGVYERAELQFLGRLVKAGDTVVDVGAHYGVYTRALSARVGPHGKVLAVEPIPPVFQILSEAVSELNNVVLHNLALSDRAQAAIELRVPLLAGGVPEPALASVQRTPSESIVYEVRAVTLDQLIAEQEHVAFIKLDVEGHELSCLAGAAETIRRCRPVVQVEISGIEQSAPAYLRFAAAHGYRLTHMTSGGRLWEFSAKEECARAVNFYLVPRERAEEFCRPAVPKRAGG